MTPTLGSRISPLPFALLNLRQGLFVISSLTVIAAAVVLAAAAVSAHAAPASDVAEPPADLRARSFELSQVRLLDGPFKEAMERNADYLLRLEPDRLLSGFRSEAGLEPKAEKYGGWEERGIAGHSLGHYLSGLAQMYAATGDEWFRERIDYIVNELATVQEANGNGYAGAIPDGQRIFAEVTRGDIRSAGFDLNGAWVPWYTQHKILAGLYDAHTLAGSEKACDVLVKLTDWACDVTEGLNDEQVQEMLACEHGGMNEVAADVYALTGDERHLALAQRFYHKAILDPLAAGRDELAGKHANTQVPKLIGLARQYELVGDERLRDTSAFFWNRVVHHHSYANGGNSNFEHFGPPDQLANRLSDNTSETCNTYNMLKLSTHLFGWRPEAEVADYFERALFNHILASQDPESGMVMYYVPLRAGSLKTYSTPFDSFWCCTGTGMENHARYGHGVYFHNTEKESPTLWVNQFLASELDWAEQNVTVRQETRFPAEETSQITIETDQPKQFALKVRRPAWAGNGFAVEVNGEPVETGAGEDGYVTLDRTWNDGDTVSISLPMTLRIEPMPDNDKRVAIAYGPILLAGELPKDVAQAELPVLTTGSRPTEEWLEPTGESPLTFRTKGVGKLKDLTLVPFHQLHGQRQIVYFDLFTNEQWEQRQAEYRAEQERLAKLEAATTDYFQPGEMQAERDHDFEGERVDTGEHAARKWRHATDGGWFTLDADPEAEHELVLSYWGSDAGGRTFDVLIDGEKVATQRLNGEQPGEFFNVTYPVPAAMTRGKRQVRVKLQAHDGQTAGGLYGARLVRKDETNPND